MITVLKVIFGLIGFCFKAVYHVLKFFRIRVLALYLVCCGLMQLIFHSFNGRAYVFWVGFGVCVLITILSWVLFLRKKFGADRAPREAASQEEVKTAKKEKQRVRKARRSEQPKFYDVAGREGYVVAEYGNRYELYFKGEGGYMLVRTDYKKSE